MVIEGIAEFLGDPRDSSLAFDNVFIAMAEGALSDVKYFIENKGIDIESRDEDGWTPLMRAAKSNENLDVLKYLISKGADIFVKSTSGRTVLHAMTQQNTNLAIYKYVLALGVDVNQKNNSGFTPLHDAASYNSSLDVFDLLLSHGADINAKNDRGQTVLHCAARDNNNLNILKYLISKGADVRAKNIDNWTLLHFAAFKNPNVEIIKYILAQGADINAKAEQEFTPLHLAAHSNPNEEVLKTLIFNGADVHAEAYGDDGVSSFKPYGIASTEEKRKILSNATFTETKIKTRDEELIEIEKTLIDFENRINNGSFSTQNNIKQIQALATNDTIMRKIQEKDYAWLDKLKNDMSEIAGTDKMSIMLTLSKLNNNYPNDEKIIKYGQRGIRIFKTIFAVSDEVQERLGYPNPQEVKEQIANMIKMWIREFGELTEEKSKPNNPELKKDHISNQSQKSNDIVTLWREKGLCTYCGGEYRGFFTKKCKDCGRPKN